MRRTITVPALIAVVLLVSFALGQRAPVWKVFTSRAGWRISYPAEWKIASCHSCKDPKAPGVFVDFFPPRMNTSEGWIMVSPLADMPRDMDVDAWLAKTSQADNLNLHLQEQKLNLNGLPALRVRYVTDDREQMEAVYVVSGSKTFSIGFEAESDYFANQPTKQRDGIPLEKLGNYATYVQMLSTFNVTPR